MANIQALFEAITDVAAESIGIKVRVNDINRSEHETIRTRLITLWRNHKEAILAIGGEDSDPLYPLSLCCAHHKSGSGDGGEEGNNSYSEFWLGKSRRKMARDYSFAIVSEEETPTSAMLGEAANEPTPKLSAS